MCLKKEQNPKTLNKELAEEFGIYPNTVSDILKRKTKYLAVDPNDQNNKDKKRVRQPQYIEVEEALVLWVMQAQTANLTISGSILLNKAQQFANLV